MALMSFLQKSLVAWLGKPTRCYPRVGGNDIKQSMQQHLQVACNDEFAQSRN
ncbi:hypothetical protein RRR_03505 [Rickettsia rickettsii str. R]|uniref:Uncharacterized protein n=1 Tax=Rickettsia rickettsii (strain Sheila Smith) TaxID=392021 RepID=A0A0H3AWZ9_RICRS|nr:hypothetical protein A1G_03740 [Rickettsia rickettsii str. 'Sheila Smith']AFB23609.1 hypothetical protein RPL_03725 [Rickettsia rickettsii str. Colombia]AFB30298.1 hypothetical protein RPM_03705 [Rickettsia rickettsii str. Hauke]AJG33094.1 hypothetical protein RRR_03505 [Rickettsia rickettsii str. R]AJG34431.1 hypothetical protein RRM_03530 [Rickettsia rickettsii str. Morgan]